VIILNPGYQGTFAHIIRTCCVLSVQLAQSVCIVKVKVVPYTFVRRGVLVRENTYPGPSSCEIGWPVPFLADFIFPVWPPGTHPLLGEQ